MIFLTNHMMKRESLYLLKIFISMYILRGIHRPFPRSVTNKIYKLFKFTLKILIQIINS